LVEVMTLGEDEGGDSPRPERPSLERPPPREQDASLPERDAPDVSVVDLRAPLDRVIDPAQVAEALERTRLVLLGKVAEDEANRRRTSTTCKPQGIELEVGNKYLLRQLTGLLIHQTCKAY
jgi:hypothetical protein